MYISLFDVEYTVTMYLHYRKKYRGMLSVKQIKKLDNEYFDWITDAANRYGDESVYEKIKTKHFYAFSIEILTPCIFAVNHNISNDTIYLKWRGKSDHNGIYDIVKRSEINDGL